jgi:hypothetical protein
VTGSWPKRKSSMQMDDRLYIGHRMDLAGKICERVRGKSRDDLE